MLFNSKVFILFFIVVYILYLLLRRNYKSQNILLLIASYFFYGFWDWRFLFLILFSTLVDYFNGIQISQSNDPTTRKRYLILSVVTNLGLLAFFKYFNFFIDSFITAFQFLGLTTNSIHLHIILPVGISFYTFQTLSYTIDIYRRKLEPSYNWIDFALFVSFFPQLVAGPIERAKRFLPQIQKPRELSFAEIDAGIFLIFWGFFKKIVIADNCGVIANAIFDNYSNFQGLDLYIGILAFSVQIYCDFSGYSDIARGISKLLGFDLMINFKLPYFALNPSDFWNRWHISLSSWLKDYLYIPLGGNRTGTFNLYKNLLITMLLGGLWHGASWNFVIWGLFHGVILILYRLFDSSKTYLSPLNSNRLEVLSKMSFMFLLTTIGWLIFRAETVDQIVYFLSTISFKVSANTFEFFSELAFFSLPLILIQLGQYKSRDLLFILKKPLWVLVLFYSFIIFSILTLNTKKVEFIYFQF